jgi:hypothetical protein
LLPLPAGPESCGCFINQKHGDGLIKKFEGGLFWKHAALSSGSGGCLLLELAHGVG